MRKLILPALLFALLAAGAGFAGEPKKEDVEKAQAQVKDFLSKLKDGEHGEVVSINSADLATTLPNHLFFAARFRIYPVARVMPEGYGPSNIMMVDKTGKVERVKDVKVLAEVFKKNMVAAKNGKSMEQTGRSWLTLTQEFHQDGFFKFEIDPSFGHSVGTIKGRAIVMAGGNGELAANLSFGDDGKLKSVTEVNAIRPGPRPICQATKLLDADPIVRKMAEQDLLYMGVAARGYLMEQRATAGLELREAIGRLWKRIEANGW